MPQEKKRSLETDLVLLFSFSRNLKISRNAHLDLCIVDVYASKQAEPEMSVLRPDFAFFRASATGISCQVHNRTKFAHAFSLCCEHLLMPCRGVSKMFHVAS